MPFLTVLKLGTGCAGESPSVLTLFDRMFVHENLTCEEQVPCYSSKKFAPVCSNCACNCAGVNNIGASIPFVIIIVELRGKQPCNAEKKAQNLHDFLTSIVC